MSSKTSSSRRSLTSATRRAALQLLDLSPIIPGCEAQAIASSASGIEMRIPRSRSSRTKRCSAFSMIYSARFRPRPAPKLRAPRSAGTFGGVIGFAPVSPPRGLLP
jgi:hypothetical protein